MDLTGTGATGGEGASASATDGAATGSPGAAGSGQPGIGQGASTGGGNAPATGADAGLSAPGERGAAAVAAAPAAPAAPSGFTFADRKFRDQKHAEDYVRAQLGILPGTQRKLASLERALDDARLRLESFERRGGPEPRGEGGQGATPPSAGPESWGKALQDSGDLDLIAEIHETKGPKAAYFALATLIGERANAQLEQAINEKIEPRIGRAETQREFDGHMNRVQAAIRHLGPLYPEFDEANDSPEAQEARSAIIAIWKEFPRQFALGNPVRALKLAVQEFRDEHGTPIFAAAPGSSGSPSAHAAAAMERGEAGATVLDTGVPARRRPSGQPATAQEELSESLGRADSLAAKTSTGFDLGVRRLS